MTERINTTDATGETQAWAVAAGAVIQVNGVAGTTARVELWGRVDSNAPFSRIISIRVDTAAFIAVEAALLEAKLVWRSNRTGDLLKAWSA